MIKCLVVEDITIKTPEGRQEIKKGQVIRLPEEPARQLMQKGKVIPVAEEPQITGYELSERMAIVGENCEPDQVKPYVTGFGVLVIPFNSPRKYHYWNGGQSTCDTLRELGRCDLIPKYKSIYSN